MIRIAREADVPRMLAIYAPYIKNTTITFEYDIPSEEAFLERFRKLTKQFPWLVWEEDGKILGYVYGSAPFERDAYRWCAEDSVYLLPEAKGKGIGTKLCTALEKVLFYQGYRRIYALITAENSESIAFHEKMGYYIQAQFPDCGFKHGRWCGLYWMEKRLKIGENPGSFPLPWLSIVQDAETFSNILDSLSLS